MHHILINRAIHNLNFDHDYNIDFECEKNKTGSGRILNFVRCVLFSFFVLCVFQV